MKKKIKIKKNIRVVIHIFYKKTVITGRKKWTSFNKFIDNCMKISHLTFNFEPYKIDTVNVRKLRNSFKTLTNGRDQ